MPFASPRPCAEPGCDQLVTKGRCPKHARQQDVSYVRAGKRIYASARWRGLRRQVLREQPFCQVLGCFTLATDVDHVVPIRDGGAPFRRANLQALCKKHHSEKTITEVFGRK
jgi:5-methylcytosine-specific restriction protein A